MSKDTCQDNLIHHAKSFNFKLNSNKNQSSPLQIPFLTSNSESLPASVFGSVASTSLLMQGRRGLTP